jgi:hypothetical protein
VLAQECPATHTVYVLKDAEYQHISTGAKLVTYVDTQQVVCALKAAEAALVSVQQLLQPIAVLEPTDFALHA